MSLEVLAEHGITSLALLQKQDALRIEAVSPFLPFKNMVHSTPLLVAESPSSLRI